MPAPLSPSGRSDCDPGAEFAREMVRLERMEFRAECIARTVRWLYRHRIRLLAFDAATDSVTVSLGNPDSESVLIRLRVTDDGFTLHGIAASDRDRLRQALVHVLGREAAELV